LNLNLKRDDWQFNYSSVYIGSHGDGVTNDFDSYLTHDFTMEYQSPYDLTVLLGVLNFTDEEPIIDPLGGWNATDSITKYLYDLAGRRTVVQVKYEF
jgi:outer membrane receptor protein involved in Fe transport